MRHESCMTQENNDLKIQEGRFFIHVVLCTNRGTPKNKQTKSFRFEFSGGCGQ